MRKISTFLAFLSLTFISFGQQQITVEEIWKDYKYMAKSVPGFNFLQDGKHYTRLEDGAIKKYDFTTGEYVETLLESESLKGKLGFEEEISGYTFSQDEKYIVIESEKEAIYRRSSKARFHVYDIKSKKLQAAFEEGKVQYATLSPDNTKLAYVYENDIYYLDLKSEETLPVTGDGEKNKIINGSADWVYEEEFSFAKAFFWSPDSKNISYLRFDESEVREFTMTQHKGGLYPEYVTFKYPKVGETNADVSVHIYNLENDKTINADLGDMTDMYIPRIKWTKDPSKLCVYKMNRHQNHLQLFLTDASKGSTSLLLEEKSKYYIDITDDMTFLDDQKQFIWSSEKSGYNHLYLYNMNGQEVKALTTGEYDVTSFYGYDEKNKTFYYQAADKTPMDRHIYSSSLQGGTKNLITDQSGTNSVQFSSTYDYYVWQRSDINSPSRIAVYDRDGNEVRLIEDNNKLSVIQSEVGVSNVEFFKFTTDYNVDLNGWMIKPSNMKKGEKYPVLMYVYGGPGSQTVTNSWKGQNYWWFQMLAQQGYVVVSIDNRGTGARGEEFKKMTYLELGKYEVEDQIAGAKYLGDLSYVDKDRIGIFGWSYGGYMSSLCILKGKDVFNSAIAVAPVTSWRWYDTIYTERYMRTEAENQSGYDDNSPVYFADQLEGNYLIMHGDSDDNVHVQNTIEMTTALISANKQFDTYIYPNKNHGIYGGNTRLHLYNKMTSFLDEHMGTPINSEEE